MIGPIAAARRRGGGGGGVTPVTWNSADKAANIALTNSDITATKITADGNAVVRATLARNGATDEGYFEVFIGTPNGVDYPFGANFRTIGLATSALSLSSFVGGNSASWGIYEDDGFKYNNGTGSAYRGSQIPHSSVVCVAMKSAKVWIGVDGVYPGNPVAGTGEMFSGLSGSLFPAMSLYLYGGGGGSEHLGALRTASAQFTHGPPTGFLPWAR